MNHKAVIFSGINEQISELLIALLNEEGYTGFKQNDNQLEAFIPADQYHPVIVEQLAEKYNVAYLIEDIVEENWNARWESNFQPVIIEDFCGIRADFHPALEKVQYEIIITPKMSFGTGHHATTRLVIELMRSIDFNNKKVLDIGTGTAILAILAEKMGAAKIVAIDNDEWAINNAGENITANNCHVISLCRQNTLDNIESGTFDIVFANITLDIIINYLPSINNNLKAAGSLLISGLLTENKADILMRLQSLNFVEINLKEKNGWLGIFLKKS